MICPTCKEKQRDCSCALTKALKEKPPTPLDLRALALWFIGDDTGSSSKYMAAVALSADSNLPTKAPHWHENAPRDHSDLGRCIRLVQSVPGIRESFPTLRAAGPVWAAFVDHWDELTTLHAAGNYQTTTARMDTLRKAASSSS